MRLLVVAVVAALGAGCSFHPSIKSGGYSCGAGGACPPGFHCGGDNRCWANGELPDGGGGDMGPCQPQSCTELGKNCGAVDNGCGASISCGSCDAPNTCGGGGPEHVCGCMPTTCMKQGWNCGTAPDGCGDTLTCGSGMNQGCNTGETCGANSRPNVCGVGLCQPLTMCPAGKNCGSISDGCGGTFVCGKCTPPQTCGAGGNDHVCGCVKTNCSAQGYDCGIAPDGCGGTIDCGGSCGLLGLGACGAGGSHNKCSTLGGSCTTKKCRAGIDCGIISDGCANVLDCGGCNGNNTCGGGGVANICG
jgi:hypothetical protein